MLIVACPWACHHPHLAHVSPPNQSADYWNLLGLCKSSYCKLGQHEFLLVWHYHWGVSQLSPIYSFCIGLATGAYVMEHFVIGESLRAAQNLFPHAPNVQTDMCQHVHVCWRPIWCTNFSYSYLLKWFEKSSIQTSKNVQHEFENSLNL